MEGWHANLKSYSVELTFGTVRTDRLDVGANAGNLIFEKLITGHIPTPTVYCNLRDITSAKVVAAQTKQGQ
jgi:hypothetical protein